MASGLRPKPRTDYRSIVGLKSTGGKSKTKGASRKSTGRAEHVRTVMEDELILEPDRDGERELLGEDFGFSSQDELDDELDDDMDTDAILALAREEEEQCDLLQEELQEQKRRKEISKERKAALEKLRLARRRRESLESSLSPTHVVPSKSPSESRRRKAEQPRRVAGGMGAEASASGSKQGEKDFNVFAFELLETIKHLKDGHSGPFSLLMAKTLSDQVDPVGVRKADSLPNMFASIPIRESKVSEFKECSTSDDLVVDRNRSGSKKKKGRDSSPEEGQLTESDSSPDRRKGKSSKHLKSGILTKPDEAGIQKVVQFAHEKLDPMHVKVRVFNSLSFHFLVAGELEIINQDRLSKEERTARVRLLKTLCYHREYLDIAELRDQYDATFKTIERGEFDWVDVDELDRQLHTKLTFRATINARGKETGRQGGTREVKSEPGSDSNRIIYCQDFNMGKCPFTEHHEGIFSKKKVTKWHVCKQCLIQDNYTKRFHPETDPACPFKKS